MLAVVAVSFVTLLAGATAALLVRTYAGTSISRTTLGGVRAWTAARPAVGAAALAGWAAVLTAVAWLAGLLIAGVTDGGSVGLVDWFAANRSRPLTTVLATATWLGDSSFALPVVALAGLAWRWRRGDWWALRLLLVAYAGSAVIYNTAKYLVATARPVGDVVLTIATGAAFPSGHAANATVLYLGLLTVTLATERGRRFDVPVAFTCGALIALVSLSRVYLGVHWLPDVVAGVLLGGAWFAAVVTVDGGPSAVQAPDRDTVDRGRAGPARRTQETRGD